MTLRPGMPSRVSSGSAGGEKNPSVISGKSEGMLAGGAVAGGAVAGGLSGVVASCPAASCEPGARTTNTAAVTSTHKRTPPRAHPAAFKPTPPVLQPTGSSIRATPSGRGGGRGGSAN
jgi:hypothetical protein